MAREERHPDRSGHPLGAAARWGQLRQDLLHGLRYPYRPTLVGVMEHQEELLTAVADGRVPCAEGGLYRPPDVAQQGVARRVAAPVVDTLEVVEVDQKDADLCPGPGAPRGLSRGQLVPPAVVEQTGQGVRHGAELELGVKLSISPGGSGDVAEQRATLEVFVGELGQAVAPHVDHAQPVVPGHEGDDEHGLFHRRLVLAGNRHGLGVAAGVRAVVRVPAKEGPSSYAAVERDVHLVKPIEGAARQHAGPKLVAVPVGLEDREAVGADHLRQVLGRDRQDPGRVVLRLHLPRSLAERPSESLSVDRGARGIREVGDDGRGVQLHAGCGEHPHALLSEPGWGDDLVPRIGPGGIKHRG